MEKQPQIKNFMTEEIFNKIIKEINVHFNTLNLKLNKIFTYQDISRENVETGNYFPKLNYEIKVNYFTKYEQNPYKSAQQNELNDIDSDTEETYAGVLRMDQFFGFINLNSDSTKKLKETFYNHGYSDMDTKKLFDGLNNFINLTILFHMYQKFGNEFLDEFMRCQNVLENLHREGNEPARYNERKVLSFFMGQIVASIVKAKESNLKVSLPNICKLLLIQEKCGTHKFNI